MCEGLADFITVTDAQIAERCASCSRRPTPGRGRGAAGLAGLFALRDGRGAEGPDRPVGRNIDQESLRRVVNREI